MPAISVLTLTVTAAAALTASRFCTAGGAVPAAGAACVGVTRTGGSAGDLVPVDVLGVTEVETGAAIAVGAAIEVDNQGRAITQSSGVRVARMAPGQAAATAAGQIVEVVLIPN